MGKEQFANGSIVYTSSDDDEKKTCIDSLKDDAHYKFSCRCGCGAQFAGYGRDIKATGKIGRAPAVETVSVTSSDSTHVQLTSDTVIVTRPGHGFVLDDRTAEHVELDGPDLLDLTEEEHAAIDHTGTPTDTHREEAAEPSRPFVSDRYLKKAQFGLSDDEIDAYHADRPDSLEAQGVDLSQRQPPGIGDLVYSLATGEGPYSLLEYQQHEIHIDDGGQSRVLCGLCRTPAGGYKTIPLADLAVHFVGRPVVKARRSWLVPTVIVLTSAAVSAAASLAYLFLLG